MKVIYMYVKRELSLGSVHLNHIYTHTNSILEKDQSFFIYLFIYLFLTLDSFAIYICIVSILNCVIRI